MDWLFSAKNLFFIVSIIFSHELPKLPTLLFYMPNIFPPKIPPLCISKSESHSSISHSSLSLSLLSLSLSLYLSLLSLFRRTPLSFPANSSLPRHSLHFLDLQLVSSTPFHFFHRNRDRSGAERPSKRFVSLSQLFFTNIIMFDMIKKRVVSIFSETQIL